MGSLWETAPRRDTRPTVSETISRIVSPEYIAREEGRNDGTRRSACRRGTIIAKLAKEQPDKEFFPAAIRLVTLGIVFVAGAAATPATDPLPSWNAGPAKQAILDFVRVTTGPSSPQFVAPDKRLATFDQDGTLGRTSHLRTGWIRAGARRSARPKHPQWKTTAPFSAVLSGNKSAIEKFTSKEFEAIVAATHTGITVTDFEAETRAWIAQARDPRWKRHYNELIYEPMLEVMKYLRDNGYKTYIVTGGGQGFVRAYANETRYGVPPEQVIGSAGYTKFEDYSTETLRSSSCRNSYCSTTISPVSPRTFVVRRPTAASGLRKQRPAISQMLEWAQSSPGAHLTMLVLHDDGVRANTRTGRPRAYRYEGRDVLVRLYRLR